MSSSNCGIRRNCAIRKKTYSGQILPIVMIILIVGVIIALALMSRTMKGKVRVMDEEHASSAANRVDSIIDSVQTMSRAEVFDELKTSSDWSNPGTLEYCLEAGYSAGTWNDDISNFWGGGVGLDEHEAASTKNTEDKLCFQKVMKTGEPITILKDDIFSIPVEDSKSGCSLNLSFDAGQGVIITKYYANTNSNGTITQIKPYAFADVEGYCLGSSCGEGWISSGIGSNIEVSLAPHSNIDLYEIRVRAVGSTALLNIDPSGGCGNVLFVRVVASSNVNGNYQSSYYELPMRDSAHSLFDYVLLGGTGQLKYTEP